MAFCSAPPAKLCAPSLPIRDTWGRRLVHCRPPYLGTNPAPEPSLIMPGIINSLIFKEQLRLIFRATPS
jgi:hypothetical protein